MAARYKYKDVKLWYSQAQIFLPSKKMDFLRVCGLTTLARRDDLLAQKRRKRRRLMRECSLSPPPAHCKRKTPSPPSAPAPMTTPYTAEQMNSTPDIEEKKDFLLMFDLSHVSPQQRRGTGSLQTPELHLNLFTSDIIWNALIFKENDRLHLANLDKERTEELLRAIQRKSVTLDTLRYNPLPPGSSPPPPSTGETNSQMHTNKHKHIILQFLRSSNFVIRWLALSAESIKRASVPRLPEPLTSLSAQAKASPAEWSL